MSYTDERHDRLSRKARRLRASDAEWDRNMPGILALARCEICAGTGYVAAGRKRKRCNHAPALADQSPTAAILDEVTS